MMRPDEFTHDERESARACGCRSCREHYDLPDEPSQVNPLANLGAFVVLGAVLVGVFKLVKHMDTQAQETKTHETAI